jgi:AraC family transcriptional regulator
MAAKVKKSPEQVFKMIRRTDSAGVLMAEAVSRNECLIPAHSHDQAHLTIIVEGFCEEIYNGKTRDITPLAVSYFHPGERHSLRVFNAPTRSFDLEIGEQWLSRLPYSITPATMIAPPHSRISGLMMRLYREFKEPDDISHLAIEALSLEMLVEIARASKGARARKAPVWLGRVMELIRDEYRRNLTLVELAQIADVHPSHLVQVFREHHQCTPGEYIRRARVEQAMRQISHSDKALADISIDLGFTDQSHFTRVFKRLTGMTPAQYRGLNTNPSSVQRIR